jgi:hypothetical protein
MNWDRSSRWRRRFLIKRDSMNEHNRCCHELCLPLIDISSRWDTAWALSCFHHLVIPLPHHFLLMLCCHLYSSVFDISHLIMRGPLAKRGSGGDTGSRGVLWVKGGLLYFLYVGVWTITRPSGRAPAPPLLSRPFKENSTSDNNEQNSSVKLICQINNRWNKTKNWQVEFSL